MDFNKFGEKIPKKYKIILSLLIQRMKECFLDFSEYFNIFSLLVSHKFNFHEIINYISYNSFLANKVELFFQKNKIFTKK